MAGIAKQASSDSPLNCLAESGTELHCTEPEIHQSWGPRRDRRSRHPIKKRAADLICQIVMIRTFAVRVFADAAQTVAKN